MRKPHIRPPAFVCLTIACLAAAAGCAGPKEAEDGSSAASARRSPQYVEMALAAAAPSVRSIQLYQTGREDELPIIPLQGQRTLTLEFDLMEEQGRTLSVYFYHADRVWRRDLSAGEYLGSFQNDNLLDYAISSGTQVPYVHYSYVFPNGNIQFLLSGNYIARVTEQGRDRPRVHDGPRDRREFRLSVNTAHRTASPAVRDRRKRVRL
jgi:hypothetical protein